MCSSKSRHVANSRAKIRSIPDFPKPGVMFKDITPLLAEPRAFHIVLDSIAELDQAIRNVELARAYKPLSETERNELLAFGRALAPTLGARYGPVA